MPVDARSQLIADFILALDPSRKDLDLRLMDRAIDRFVERIADAPAEAGNPPQEIALELALEYQIQMALNAASMGGMTEGQKSFYEGKAAGVKQALNSVRIALPSPPAASKEKP